MPETKRPRIASSRNGRRGVRISTRPWLQRSALSRNTGSPWSATQLSGSRDSQSASDTLGGRAARETPREYRTRSARPYGAVEVASLDQSQLGSAASFEEGPDFVGGLFGDQLARDIFIPLAGKVLVIHRRGESSA